MKNSQCQMNPKTWTPNALTCPAYAEELFCQASLIEVLTSFASNKLLGPEEHTLDEVP